MSISQERALLTEVPRPELICYRHVVGIGRISAYGRCSRLACLLQTYTIFFFDLKGSGDVVFAVCFAMTCSQNCSCYCNAVARILYWVLLMLLDELIVM